MKNELGEKTPQNTKRLFVAAGLTQEIKQELAAVQAELKPFARDEKWVNPEGIHLTLKFLGYVNENRIEGIIDSLRNAALLMAPFRVDVRGFGAFPNSKRPNVLWAGITAPDMIPLQSRIEEEMGKIGFEKEDRPYHPHLTLARFKDSHGLQSLMGEVEKKKEMAVGAFTAVSFALYESILLRTGAQYNVIKTFELEGTRSTL